MSGQGVELLVGQDELSFLVQGSEDAPYTVTFRRVHRGFIANCDCRAGQSGQSCKHRLRILQGSADGLVSVDREHIRIVSSWLAESPVAAAIAALESAEEALERAKKDVAAAKKRLARALLGQPS